MLFRILVTMWESSN